MDAEEQIPLARLQATTDTIADTPRMELLHCHVADRLNARMLATYVSRNYHWNVVGSRFNNLHKSFANQYETLDDMIDEVAERARALGGSAFGTLAEFTKHARLTETSR